MRPAQTLQCPHCSDAFARDAYLQLHVGRAHAETMGDEERRAYEAALANEEAWLTEFQRHVKAGLVALPIAVIYLLIILMLEISGLGFAWGLLLLPGVAAFGVLAYVLTYASTKKDEEEASARVDEP